VGFTPRDEESEVAAGQRRKLTSDFRNEAVKLALETGRPIAEVARGIGVARGDAGELVNLWRTVHTGEEPELGVSERAELAQLRHGTRRIGGSGSPCKLPRPSSPAEQHR
jgi:transposase